MARGRRGISLIGPNRLERGGLLLVVALAVLASIGPARAADASRASTEAIVDRLLAEADVILSAREIDVYHCAPRTRIGLPEEGPVAADPLQLRAFLDDKIARFRSDAAPPYRAALPGGLYGAFEPVSCFGFGGVGDGWAIVRLVVPAGSSMLDLRQPASRADFTPAVLEALAGTDCGASSLDELLMTRAEPACRPLAVALLDRLGIDALVLEFPGFRFRHCVDAATGSLLILDPAVAEGARVLVREVPEPPRSDALALRRQVQEIVALAAEQGSTRDAPFAELPFESTPSARRVLEARHLVCSGPGESRPIEIEPAGRVRSAKPEASNPGEALSPSSP